MPRELLVVSHAGHPPLTVSPAGQVRDRALSTVLELHQSSAPLATLIEQHAVERLKWLSEEAPPPQLAADQQR